jgi:cell division protein FtsI (penicillin-binding protein 3)
MGRLIVFVVLVAVAGAAVGARLTDIQVTSRAAYVAYGADQRDGFRTLPAGRGAIYDRHGQAFALSLPEPNVVADPLSINDPVDAARRLAPVLEIDEATLIEKLSAGPSRYQVLAATVTPDVAGAVGGLDLAGITLEDHFVRQNPSGDLARAVVGRTHADGLVDAEGRQGLTGVEAAFEEELRGTPGERWYERDPDGNTIAGTPERTQPARPGTDLHLTLDQSLQYATEQALVEQVEATGASQAMAIIAHPSTGEVLAMASVADDGDGTITSTDDNRSVATVFEPGSVNKVITVAGALEEGLVGPDTVHQVPDRIQVADHLFTDHEPHATEDWTTTDILVTSSNVGTIQLAQALGSEKIDAYLRDFGFGSASGGFPGEVNGLLLPLDDWSGTSIGAIPLGQGISVTALQMLGAYNVIANDGIYVPPTLVAATDSGTGKAPSVPAPGRRVLSTETATAVRHMLAKVVTDGTGVRAGVPGYVAFGKTGTARIPQFGGDDEDAYKDADGQYHYESSFVGGIDGADLSIIVTVQNAETSIYGSELAAPVFADLASLALRREQIPPPALLEDAQAGVPELSASAREVEGEDPGPISPATQG